MIAIARSDDERDDLSILDTHVIERAKRQHLRAFGHTMGKHFARMTTTHLQRPGDAIAALGMRIEDIASNVQRVRAGTAPGDH